MNKKLEIGVEKVWVGLLTHRKNEQPSSFGEELLVCGCVRGLLHNSGVYCSVGSLCEWYQRVM